MTMSKLEYMLKEVKKAESEKGRTSRKTPNKFRDTEEVQKSAKTMPKICSASFTHEIKPVASAFWGV